MAADEVLDRLGELPHDGSYSSGQNQAYLGADVEKALTNLGDFLQSTGYLHQDAGWGL